MNKNHQIGILIIICLILSLTAIAMPSATKSDAATKLLHITAPSNFF